MENRLENVENIMKEYTEFKESQVPKVSDDFVKNLEDKKVEVSRENNHLQRLEKELENINTSDLDYVQLPKLMGEYKRQINASKENLDALNKEYEELLAEKDKIENPDKTLDQKNKEKAERYEARGKAKKELISELKEIDLDIEEQENSLKAKLLEIKKFKLEYKEEEQSFEARNDKGELTTITKTVRVPINAEKRQELDKESEELRNNIDGLKEAKSKCEEYLTQIDEEFKKEVEEINNILKGKEKPGPTKPEQTKPEQTKPEPTKPEPIKPEPTKPEPTKPEPTKPEPTKPEPTKPELTKPEPTKPEPTKPEPTKPQPTKPQPTKPGPKPGSKINIDQIYDRAKLQIDKFFEARSGISNYQDTDLYKKMIKEIKNVKDLYNFDGKENESIVKGLLLSPVERIRSVIDRDMVAYKNSKPSKTKNDLTGLRKEIIKDANMIEEANLSNVLTKEQLVFIENTKKMLEKNHIVKDIDVTFDAKKHAYVITEDNGKRSKVIIDNITEDENRKKFFDGLKETLSAENKSNVDPVLAYVLNQYDNLNKEKGIDSNKYETYVKALNLDKKPEEIQEFLKANGLQINYNLYNLDKANKYSKNSIEGIMKKANAAQEKGISTNIEVRTLGDRISDFFRNKFNRMNIIEEGIIPDLILGEKYKTESEYTEQDKELIAAMEKLEKIKERGEVGQTTHEYKEFIEMQEKFDSNKSNKENWFKRVFNKTKKTKAHEEQREEDIEDNSKDFPTFSEWKEKLKFTPSKPITFDKSFDKSKVENIKEDKEEPEKESKFRKVKKQAKSLGYSVKEGFNKGRERAKQVAEKRRENQIIKRSRQQIEANKKKTGFDR